MSDGDYQDTRRVEKEGDVLVLYLQFTFPIARDKGLGIPGGAPEVPRLSGSKTSPVDDEVVGSGRAHRPILPGFLHPNEFGIASKEFGVKHVATLRACCRLLKGIIGVLSP